MTPVPNPRVMYAKPIPQGAWPVVGEHLVYDNSRTIDPETVPLNGGFLTKALYLSPEPYMRERMREEHIASYSSPMLAGAPVVGLCVMQIVRSEKPEFKPGDLVYGASHWELYTVQPYMEARRIWNPAEWPWWTANMDDFGDAQKIPDSKGAFSLAKYCVAGSPGMTAYVSWKKYANAKEGQTVFVSAGASAVGSLVIQLAKLDGMKVIASAGSDAKVEYLRSLGCDIPFNYKKKAYKEVLAEHGPLDVYYDNVGAEALAAALDNMNLNQQPNRPNNEGRGSSGPHSEGPAKTPSSPSPYPVSEQFGQGIESPGILDAARRCAILDAARRCAILDAARDPDEDPDEGFEVVAVQMLEVTEAVQMPNYASKRVVEDVDGGEGDAGR